MPAATRVLLALTPLQVLLMRHHTLWAADTLMLACES